MTTNPQKGLADARRAAVQKVEREWYVEASEVHGPLNERTAVWVRTWDGEEAHTVLVTALRGQGLSWGKRPYIVSLIAPVSDTIGVAGPLDDTQVLHALGAGGHAPRAQRVAGIRKTVNYALEVLGG